MRNASNAVFARDIVRKKSFKGRESTFRFATATASDVFVARNFAPTAQ